MIPLTAAPISMAICPGREDPKVSSILQKMIAPPPEVELIQKLLDCSG
jgi:hypothetical protein